MDNTVPHNPINQYFLGLKDELLHLSESMSQNTIYQDFYAYLALIATGEVLHCSADDRDRVFMEAELRGEKYYGFQPNGEIPHGVTLCFGMQVPNDSGLAPIELNAGQSIGYCSRWGGSTYIDEFGNTNALHSNSVLSGKGCCCWVCAIQKKPQAAWQPLDYEIAQAATAYVKSWLEGVADDYTEITIDRTAEELSALRIWLKDKMAHRKSLSPILDLVKSLLVEGKTINEIKTTVKNYVQGKQSGVPEQLFKSDFTMWAMKD